MLPKPLVNNISQRWSISFKADDMGGEAENVQFTDILPVKLGN